MSGHSGVSAAHWAFYQQLCTYCKKYKYKDRDLYRMGWGIQGRAAAVFYAGKGNVRSPRSGG